MNEFTGRTDAMSDVLELVRPVPAAEAVSDQDHGGVIRRVGIEGRHGHPLEWLRLTTQFLADEARNPKPATAITIGRLIEILFIQAVREWGGKSNNSLGWLSGLKDPAIGRALTAIHNDPARKWTLADLAVRASLSRSAFAVRFAEVAGQTPLRYLTLWRLGLAADQLRSGTATIAEIAENVGYASESALTRAFKAQYGTTPAHSAKYRLRGASQK